MAFGEGRISDLHTCNTYAGANAVLTVLDHMLKQGSIEQLHKTITNHGRHLESMYGARPRVGRH
jgi:hypothetical protein